ncbi:MAG: hypothetical protein QOK31_37 [Solirubrobacteraceae bacterium]|nr:hypothetical protein [Solirubrobacteraceae bacterium]
MLAVAAVFVAVLVSVARSPASIRHAADGLGVWGPVVFVLLAAGLALALFPYPLVAAASGLLFGTAGGTALSVTGGTLGAVLACLIARHVAGDAVRQLAGDRLEPLQAAVERRGFVTVLYARIFPGVPRDVVNYAFGLTRVHLRDFTLATLIGIAPRAYAYTALGGSLSDLGRPQALVAVAVLVLMGVGGALLLLRERRRGAGEMLRRSGSG